MIPTSPVDPIRPALHAQPDTWVIGGAPSRDELPAEFVKQFDTIIVMHVPEWIERNWEVLKGKRVIWRTIGQSTPAIEQRMGQYKAFGMEIVRYSTREANITPTAGCDKIIRFYKDEREFGGWIGAGNEVITFAQDMKHRAEHCNYDTFTQIVQGFNAHVYGPKNEKSGDLNGGFMTYPQMQQKMRDARVYIYTGTQPASYTLNFIEALMTGVPMVAIGPKLANSLNVTGGDVYEIPDIIKNGVNGYYSDDINELRARVQGLLDDWRLARRIGEMGRIKAIELFGKSVIQDNWRRFLGV